MLGVLGALHVKKHTYSLGRDAEFNGEPTEATPFTMKEESLLTLSSFSQLFRAYCFSDHQLINSFSHVHFQSFISLLFSSSQSSWFTEGTSEILQTKKIHRQIEVPQCFSFFFFFSDGWFFFSSFLSLLGRTTEFIYKSKGKKV